MTEISDKMPSEIEEFDESADDCSDSDCSECSDYSDSDSDCSVEIILNITGTTPFHLMKKEEGYSFVTQNITNLDHEIKKLNAGELITWWTYELPSRPNSTYTTKPLYIVKVWLKKWTNTDMHKHLLMGNKARINISKTSYWMVQHLNEILPF